MIRGTLAEVYRSVSFTQDTRLGYIAVLRILAGYHFIASGYAKLTQGFIGGNALATQLIKTAPSDPLSWHRAFILGFVVPHSNLFSYIVAFGETAIGLSLLFGCLVRLSASFGAFHNANILFAIAFGSGGATIGINRLFILLHLVFVCSSAGRSLGIDGLLRKRFPHTWLF